ncbi:MAG: DUF4147 domain-containing protein [Planctomycetes bacterium]|nr:DUF4147 domain-containing protein [Planctomycetota bacterium]
MQRTCLQLREDAQQIWAAGLRAVQPEHLIPKFVSVAENKLVIDDEAIDLQSIDRLVIVGAGKAGASMTTAVETALGEEVLQSKRVGGWVNVPANCVQTTRAVQLHAARPAGVNEPTTAGVEGTREILRLVGELGPRDLCLCLISGGGSALLPAPADGLSLATKVALTREIAARGGTIHQLNTVRRELSAVKGGGLARACRAGRLITLILSDVLGDDLETIASGPTVDREPTPDLALAVFDDLQLTDCPAGKEAAAWLRLQTAPKNKTSNRITTQVTNLLIANNATAVDAAGIEAEKLGYSHAMISARESEPTAEEVAERLVDMAQSMRGQPGPDCLISGGEPTVQLAAESERGLGGRNQQLTLAALAGLDDWQGLALLSAGTDGEDGPTDAAGAFVDEQIVAAARNLNLDPLDYLRRNDAYHFFAQSGGLLITGPTHTNVCDLRVLTVSQ